MINLIPPYWRLLSVWWQQWCSDDDVEHVDPFSLPWCLGLQDQGYKLTSQDTSYLTTISFYLLIKITYEYCHNIVVAFSRALKSNSSYRQHSLVIHHSNYQTRKDSAASRRPVSEIASCTSQNIPECPFIIIHEWDYEKLGRTTNIGHFSEWVVRQLSVICTPNIIVPRFRDFTSTKIRTENCDWSLK